MEDYEIKEEWLATPTPVINHRSDILTAVIDNSQTNKSSNWSLECMMRQSTENMSNLTTEQLTQICVDQNLKTHTDLQDIPRELTFTEDSLVSVIAYTILLFISGICNLLVFMTLFRRRHRKSRVNLLIMHLCIADMIVTFVMIPLEIGWHLTVTWQAGDIGCRLLMFFRAFGFYLSSFTLITISLDRYFVIINPLSLSDAGKRAKIMLCLAWVLSVLSSIPQSVIFHVEKHPAYPWFQQCVTFNFFPSWSHELAYNLFNITALYLAPLVVIVVSYTLILCEINRKARGHMDECKNIKGQSQFSKNSFVNNKDHGYLRNYGMGLGRIERARLRTLKMTLVIVGMFVACWTPYFVISMWWWVDKASAAKIDAKIQRALFLFAVSNSCVNPIIYGMFTHTFLRDVKKLFAFKQTKKRKFSCQPIIVHNSSSRSGFGIKCVKDLMKIKETAIPLSAKTESHKSKSRYIREELVYTACAVVLPNDERENGLNKGIPIRRVDTPPHISVGKGIKDSLEKYFLI